VKIVTLVFVVVMVVILAIRSYLTRNRGGGMAAFAKQHGLKYSPGGEPFDVREYGFPIFQKGEGRRFENSLWGKWHGLPVKGGDYSFLKKSVDSEGRPEVWQTSFSVALTHLNCVVPYVSISRENLLKRIGKHVFTDLFLQDIDFESEEFNRVFVVKSKDREFAFKLIDAQMMQYLLGTGGRFGIEVMGSHLLVFCDRLNPTKLAPLFDTVKAVRDHIPKLVWTEYGSAPPARAARHGKEASDPPPVADASASPPQPPLPPPPAPLSVEPNDRRTGLT
jgi:uncharacterized protein DUF3137